MLTWWTFSSVMPREQNVADLSAVADIHSSHNCHPASILLARQSGAEVGSSWHTLPTFQHHQGYHEVEVWCDVAQGQGSLGGGIVTVPPTQNQYINPQNELSGAALLPTPRHWRDGDRRPSWFWTHLRSPACSDMHDHFVCNLCPPPRISIASPNDIAT